MKELVVILDDFFAAPSPTTYALPRLAALETLLARARREPLGQDWRVWLAARTGAAVKTPAEILADAWGVQCRAAEAGESSSGSHRGCWLATPVHMVAGMDRVLLHPSGLLRLADAEQQQLVEQFAQVFGGSPWQLHARSERELLLVGPAIAASGRDPARFLGTDPAEGLPHGARAAPLRSLGSELELWLHEHRLNRERARRGALSISTLWLWGGGLVAAESRASSGPLPSAHSAPLDLYGSDACAAALVRWRGGACLALSAGLASTAVRQGAARSVVLYPLQAQETDEAPAGRVDRLEQLEQRWLAPALASLRARRIDALLLVAADHVYHLDRPGSWRLWRARAPWWEELG